MAYSPVFDDDELRQRYNDLPPLEEMEGERTYISRCSTWEHFVERGPMAAEQMRRIAERQPELAEIERSQAPELYDLLLEAWPPSDS